ncbi:MAG: hypothetical protein A2W80_11825 [Candidatus Riflebacteria bacterium GWC2_50_8]|nr:MAG: hypothetical protein A2W80_11825 [Candidatus Riflebacteria bacterium GWC2_50_8]
MRISFGLLLVSLIILVREIGWRDVGAWPAGVALSVLLASLALLVYLATRGKTVHERQTDGVASAQYGIPSYDRVPGATTGTDTMSIHYLLHLAEPGSTSNSRISRALCLLVEQMPDKIFAIYTVSANRLEFAGGARINSRQKSETIKAADQLIEELSTRVNSCIDGRALKQPDSFIKPLSFSRSDDLEDGLLLPVAHNGELFAVLAALSTSRTEFISNEKDLLQHFCASLAILFNNQRRLGESNDDKQAEAENRLTHRLFAELLPESAKAVAGWDIAQLTGYSSDHSGDFHDYISLPGNRMLIIAGKTSGRGINAALYVARLRTMLSCLSENCLSPADLLNNLSVRLTGDKSLDLFASLIAIQIKANDRNITLAVAGHATPLINRPRSGYVEIPTLATGVPLGLFSQGIEAYQNQVIQLLPGDGILIYTDGAIDFAGAQGSHFGSEDLKVLLDKMPEQYADDLLANLAEQLIPENFRNRPLEDYTFIYASTE